MKKTLNLLPIGSAALLVACGGGGGGTQTAAVPATPATPAVPVIAAATLVTSVAPASYTGQSAAAFALWNAERSQCGFGLLAQNAQLDAAAAAHASYLAVNNSEGHSETAGLPGFTGVAPLDRIIAKAYAGTVFTTSEVAAGGVGSGQGAAGTASIRLLFSGPYHLRAMVDSFREVGMAYSNSVDVRFVADLGYQTGASAQLLGGSDVKTYPCEGSTGVAPDMKGEIPNPVPGRNLTANPLGTSVLVRVRDGNVLVIKTASMIQVSNGAAVAVRPVVNAANDPNKVNGLGYFRPSEAYFAADAGLLGNSQYQVSVTGTNNGVDFSRSFTFTTGPRS